MGKCPILSNIQIMNQLFPLKIPKKLNIFVMRELSFYEKAQKQSPPQDLIALTPWSLKTMITNFTIIIKKINLWPNTRPQDYGIKNWAIELWLAIHVFAHYSTQINFGLPLKLIPSHSNISLLTGAATDLRSTKQFVSADILITYWCNPKAPEMHLYLISSFLVFPLIRLNVLISEKLILYMCCLLAAQHFAPQRMVGLYQFYTIFPSILMAFLYHTALQEHLSTSFTTL